MFKRRPRWRPASWLRLQNEDAGSHVICVDFRFCHLSSLFTFGNSFFKRNLIFFNEAWNLIQIYYSISNETWHLIQN